jgi:hypothetical protein
MGATVLSSPKAVAHASVQTLAVTWQLSAAVAGAGLVVIGTIVDLSWHVSVGKDPFLAPAHLIVFLGVAVAAAWSALAVFDASFGSNPESRAASVRVWWLRGPFAAWVSLWGALAIIIATVYDNWWHKAFGLDERIGSPPHALLSLGMVAIVAGAAVSVLAARRAETASARRRDGFLFASATGLVLSAIAVALSEFSGAELQHTAAFYELTCAIFPLVLVAVARSSSARWPATTAAAVYSVLIIGVGLILPHIPAAPMLAPVYEDITRMVPPDFPLLLIVPAFAIDLVARWGRDRNAWTMAVVQGVVFFAVFAAVQSTFADFLVSPLSDNALFHTRSLPYWLPRKTYWFHHEFVPLDATTTARTIGLAIALMGSVVSARLGLGLGGWLRGVRR